MPRSIHHGRPGDRRVGANGAGSLTRPRVTARDGQRAAMGMSQPSDERHCRALRPRCRRLRALLGAGAARDRAAAARLRRRLRPLRDPPRRRRAHPRGRRGHWHRCSGGAASAGRRRRSWPRMLRAAMVELARKRLDESSIDAGDRVEFVVSPADALDAWPTRRPTWSSRRSCSSSYRTGSRRCARRCACSAPAAWPPT